MKTKNLKLKGFEVQVLGTDEMNQLRGGQFLDPNWYRLARCKAEAKDHFFPSPYCRPLVRAPYIPISLNPYYFGYSDQYTSH